MNAEPQWAGACPVCGAAYGPDDERCPACNYPLAGVGGRPGAYSRAALWWTIAGFVAVYLVVLAIVAVTR